MLIYPLKMVIFHSFLYVYQRLNPLLAEYWTIEGYINIMPMWIASTGSLIRLLMWIITNPSSPTIHPLVPKVNSRHESCDMFEFVGTISAWFKSGVSRMDQTFCQVLQETIHFLRKPMYIYI
jgi:hypothetical protein